MKKLNYLFLAGLLVTGIVFARDVIEEDIALPATSTTTFHNNSGQNLNLQVAGRDSVPIGASLPVNTPNILTAIEFGSRSFIFDEIISEGDYTINSIRTETRLEQDDYGFGPEDTIKYYYVINITDPTGRNMLLSRPI